MEGNENNLEDSADASDDVNSQDILSKDDLIIVGYNGKETASSSEPDVNQDKPRSDAMFGGSSAPKTYSCDSCEYWTVHPGHLKAHIFTHTGEKPYPCGECEYRATSIANLKRHNLTHLGLKPYTCDICGHTARSTSNLKVHKRIHSGDRPFECKFCDYCTNDTTKLKRHVLKNHSDGGDCNGVSTCRGFKDCCLPKRQTMGPAGQAMSGEKRFTCNVCLYNTGLCSDFKKHLKTHAPAKQFFCHLCDYRATTPTNLKIHVRVHTGEKPYECAACPYRARTGPQLKIHMRTHTGEKPFVCHVCGYKTGQSPHLKKHILRHHPNDFGTPEVADFSHVVVVSDRPLDSGADVTEGVRVKEEAPDDLPSMSDFTEVTVKQEASDFDDVSTDIGEVKVKEEVMDYDSGECYGQSVASNVNPTDGKNSEILINDVTTFSDMNGIKIKEEVVVYDFFNDGVQ